MTKNVKILIIVLAIILLIVSIIVISKNSKSKKENNKKDISEMTIGELIATGEGESFNVPREMPSNPSEIKMTVLQ